MAAAEGRETPPRRSAPFVVAFLLIAVTLVGGITGVVIFLSYRLGLGIVADTGGKLFQQLQTDAAVQQHQLIQPLEFSLSVLAEDPALGAGEADSLTNVLLNVIEHNLQISEMRIAHQTGELIAVTNLTDVDEALRQSVGAPDDARFVKRRVARGTDGKWRTTWTFLGIRRMTLGDRSVEIEAPCHDEAAWFADAVARPGHTIQTKAVVLSSFHAAVVSLARAFPGPQPGVIAGDVSLARLSEIFESLKFTSDDQLFLFDEEGRLLASPGIEIIKGSGDAARLRPVEALPHPIAMAMLEKFREGGSFYGASLTTGGTEFLASVIRLDDEAQGWPATYLALATPAATFTGFIVEATRQSALISILIFLLATPAIVWAARRIARPLTALESAAQDIAQLDLTRPVEVGSRIREIESLGQSFGNMQNALGQIAKFVPKAVVQQLIRSRARMDVGGERRELSFMFSDVRDFTPMAESLPAEELMSRMSTYLETLVREILAQGGTVDKYVGDAIFAFWNAPVRQENHVILACEAALACRHASNTLNIALERQGKQPWYTRFSVHLGEAVVGNVGSSDRLDYTAVGNAVNMASRLEGLNKHYGTQILASDAVVARTGERFLFRPLDRVLPKGAITPVAIYELIGPRAAANAEILERCRKWAAVYEMYQSGDWAGARAAAADLCARDAGDTVAAAFKARMANLLAAPPPGWDGVTHFETK